MRPLKAPKSASKPVYLTICKNIVPIVLLSRILKKRMTDRRHHRLSYYYCGVIFIKYKNKFEKWEKREKKENFFVLLWSMIFFSSRQLGKIITSMYVQYKNSG